MQNSWNFQIVVVAALSEQTTIPSLLYYVNRNSEFGTDGFGKDF